MAALLFCLNFYVCRELFSIEYLRHMGSIEGAYIGISRYAIAHWRDLTWFPLWYNGIPYQNTYPPLLHLGVALVAVVRGITPAHAHHWTTALAYCLGPVTLFALIRRLCGSTWAGFAAGLIYSAVSPSAWLIADIAKDVGGVFHPRRLQALVFYGEGPHVAAMTLLPLAILLVDLAVRKRKGYYFAGAAMMLAGVVLTNWLAAFALALCIGAYSLATAGRWRDVFFIGAIGTAAYGLAMPWIPPSTIAVTQFNARVVGGDFTMVYRSLPGWLAVMACALGLLKLVMRRCSSALQFAVFFAFVTVLITLSDAWFRVAIVPQPSRYHLEMEMALAVLTAIAGYELLRGNLRKISMGLLILVLVLPVRSSRHYARGLIGSIDITRTSEWKTADWLNRNWSGERVMLPGSSAYWLTAFSDTPQLNGGFAQGVTDYMVQVASYGLVTGAKEHWPEWGVLWLKAMGVQAVGVSGPGSTEVYRDFVDPKKFEGLLEPLWRDGGDVLYRVRKARGSLAWVVPRRALVTRTPANERDVDPLRGYVAALEDASMPEARMAWTSAHSARIETELKEGQVVSLQIAFHPGWHARSGSEEIPIARDALGMMTIYPKRSGVSAIDLVYDGGFEMKVAKWICGITMFILLGWAVKRN